MLPQMIQKVVATGYGRIAVDFADHVITEITCHARGGRELAWGGLFDH